ncbi:transposase [Thalassomonas actiniarum]|uniref:Transposase n=1 Tax=Thalassomonas actiniarum TaxID=485447 RepID=A0AAE9YSM6_9GAMM|nr:transposase [Thalassomonas actiniarum]
MEKLIDEQADNDLSMSTFCKKNQLNYKSFLYSRTALNKQSQPMAQSQGEFIPVKENWALSHIQKLYRLENQVKGELAEDKCRLRQEKAVPLLKQMKAWLNKSVM